MTPKLLLLHSLIAEPSTECIEWPSSRYRGYGIVWNGRRNLRAHRAAWEIANSQHVPQGMLVCHTCDNPPCVNPAHLYVGTPADNARDRTVRGRGADHRGALNGRAKLTPGQIAEAARRHAAGETWRSLAASFGVKSPSLSAACRGVKWAHLLEATS